MGVILYRIGNTHNVRGWECEKQIFDAEFLNLKARLNEGWYLSPSCGREKDTENGLQQEKRSDEEKPKKQKKEKILSKKQIVDISLEHLKEIDTLKTQMEKYTYVQLRQIAKKNGLNSSRMNKSALKDFLIKSLLLIGEDDDVQDRHNKQCIQPSEDKRDYDDKPESTGDGTCIESIGIDGQ